MHSSSRLGRSTQANGEAPRQWTIPPPLKHDENSWPLTGDIRMEQFTNACYGSCLLGHALRAFGWATHTHLICSTQPWPLVPRAWPNLGQVCSHWSTGPAIGDAGRASGWLSLLETKSNCWHLDAVGLGSKCWVISHSHGSEPLIVGARAERKPTCFLLVLKTQKVEIPLPPKQHPQVVS